MTTDELNDNLRDMRRALEAFGYELMGEHHGGNSRSLDELQFVMTSAMRLRSIIQCNMEGRV